MTTYTVRTQSELDAALQEHASDWSATILIDSPQGVWLRINAYGSATVGAYGSATVEAYGSATVRAYDSATVRAYDSATVRAYGSATVRAYGSATVGAYGSATVRASKFVAVHLHSARVDLTGGVVIAVHELDLTDVQTWIDYTGAETDDDDVILYKAVDDSLNAGHSYRLTAYPLGESVTAPDFRDDHECGGGLHASPHPHQALSYYPGAKRMLRVAVSRADLRPIEGGTAKAKARTVRVLGEVTLSGDALAEVTA